MVRGGCGARAARPSAHGAWRIAAPTGGRPARVCRGRPARVRRVRGRAEGVADAPRADEGGSACGRGRRRVRRQSWATHALEGDRIASRRGKHKGQAQGRQRADVAVLSPRGWAPPWAEVQRLLAHSGLARGSLEVPGGPHPGLTRAASTPGLAGSGLTRPRAASTCTRPALTHQACTHQACRHTRPAQTPCMQGVCTPALRRDVMASHAS
jgi:hypothetical protein